MQDRPDSAPAVTTGHAARDAERTAEAAARAAGVSVRELTTSDEIHDALRAGSEIWNGDHLRDVDTTGGYVVGAYDGEDLIGITAGAGPLGEHTAYSHVTAVSPRHHHRGVGLALKLHERSWALRRGVRTLRWTIDPLASGPAYVSVAELGAVVEEYLPDARGDLADAGDRLRVRWHLLDSPAALARDGRTAKTKASAALARGAAVLLDRSADGAPVIGARPSPGSVGLIATPRRIEDMRRSTPRRAREWRLAMREVLQPLLGTGGTITGFDPFGWYVARAPEAPAGR